MMDFQALKDSMIIKTFNQWQKLADEEGIAVDGDITAHVYPNLCVDIEAKGKGMIATIYPDDRVIIYKNKYVRTRLEYIEY